MHTLRLARQTIAGFILAALIFSAWLGLHGWALFSFRIGADTWQWVPLIAGLQCWLSVGAFIVAHDAMHRSLLPLAPRLGDAIGAALLWLYAGFGWRTMRDAHFAHHHHPGTELDPDFCADAPHVFWRWYGVFLRRYFGWRSALWIGSVVTSYALLIRLPIENIVLLYACPAIASSLQLFYFGTFRPHRHEPDHGFADAHRARSSGYGYAASLVSCFHFGYHHVHHLQPYLPWWALPKAEKIRTRLIAIGEQ